MHKYQISKIWGVFKSKVTEARYFESIRNNIIPEMRNGFIIGIAILWFYSFLDFLVLGKPTSTGLVIAKIIPTMTSALIIYFSKRIKSFQLFYWLITLNLFLFLAVAVYIFLEQSATPIQMALTQIIFIMGVTLLIPNRFINLVLVSLSSSLIFTYIDITNPRSVHADNFIIIAAFISYNIFLFQFDLKAQIVSRLKFRELVKEQKYIRVLNKEILKRIELEKKLTEMACMDSLTGACNRRFFLDLAEHERKKCIRLNSALSIMVIDIDDFKIINDTYGHAIGDKALKVFMKICKSSLRESDVIGRLGGEEFAILCSESNKHQTMEIASRLCKKINEQTSKFEYHFTISIGVAEVKKEFKTIDKALHLADLALYEAKRTGKNRAICA